MMSFLGHFFASEPEYTYCYVFLLIHLCIFKDLTVTLPLTLYLHYAHIVIKIHYNRNTSDEKKHVKYAYIISIAKDPLFSVLTRINSNEFQGRVCLWFLHWRMQTLAFNFKESLDLGGMV